MIQFLSVSKKIKESDSLALPESCTKVTTLDSVVNLPVVIYDPLFAKGSSISFYITECQNLHSI